MLVFGSNATPSTRTWIALRDAFEPSNFKPSGPKASYSFCCTKAIDFVPACAKLSLTLSLTSVMNRDASPNLSPINGNLFANAIASTAVSSNVKKPSMLFVRPDMSFARSIRWIAVVKSGITKDVVAIGSSKSPTVKPIAGLEGSSGVPSVGKSTGRLT